LDPKVGMRMLDRRYLRHIASKTRHWSG
jgi:hypothetical protein